MALTQPGSAAGGAVDAPRSPEPVPQPSDDDHLLETVRRGLERGDPVAHLLAGWVAPPARAVCTTPVRPAGTATTRTAGTS